MPFAISVKTLRKSISFTEQSDYSDKTDITEKTHLFLATQAQHFRTNSEYEECSNNSI